MTNPAKAIHSYTPEAEAAHIEEHTRYVEMQAMCSSVAPSKAWCNRRAHPGDTSHIAFGEKPTDYPQRWDTRQEFACPCPVQAD